MFLLAGFLAKNARVFQVATLIFERKGKREAQGSGKESAANGRGATEKRQRRDRRDKEETTSI